MLGITQSKMRIFDIDSKNCLNVLQTKLRRPTFLKTCANKTRGRGQGCQVQVNKKCQTTCKKMPNRFKKCQTSWNRPNALGFDISTRIIWQKHSGTREQDDNYSIQSKKQLLHFRNNKQI